MFEMTNENDRMNGAKIKVIGIGGGGCNAVNTMIRSGLSGVEYIVANTDAQALSVSLAEIKIQLGGAVTKGLGAGANPDVGKKAALEDYEKISEVLRGADMVFITAGMGGGTGTGAAPVIAKLAKELGALTVGVVTKPFVFEGKKRFKQAEEGIRNLEESVDSLITIPNQRLLYLAGENLSLVDTFKKADEVLLNAVRGISDLINNTGHINADFADVATVMANKGLALMGTGVASGPGRAIKAATEAISSPLLEDISINGATGIIINITGSDSLSMHETNEAVTLIMEAADENAEIIFGTVIDNNSGEDIKVTVIATGLGGQIKVYQEQKNIPPVERVVVEEVVASPVVEEVSTSASAHGDRSDFERFMSDRNAYKNASMNEEESLSVKSGAPREEAPPSKLIQQIREAANRYEATSTSNAPGTTEPVGGGLSTRAKSIAEKLGFVNFDEDEFDTPSYLRKDEKGVAENKPSPKEYSKNIDL